MSVTDLILTAVILSLVPVCFIRPWIGVLVWTWIGLMNPHKLSWGFAYSFPFALIVAVATLAGTLRTRDHRPFPRTAGVYLLFALWGVFCLSTFYAINPDGAWDQLDKVSKIFLMTLLAMKLLQDPKKVRALLWIIALSVGYYGVKGGIWSLLRGSQNPVLGPPGSFMSGNTEIGLALNVVLPILVFLRREDRRPWARLGLLAAIVLCPVAILGTYSRGAFLGLGVVLFLLLVKARRKVLVLAAVGVALFVATAFLPEKWFERMETIQTYEADSSAVARLQTWELSLMIGRDRPLLGAGFRPFTLETYKRYMPEYPMMHRDRLHDAHSIFFQVLAEHGFIGLALYVGLLLATWWRLRSLRRRTRGDPAQRWIFNCCDMLEVSLAGYVVCGIFLSLSYFDLYYYIVAIPSILTALIETQERRRDGGAAEGAGPPVLARRELSEVR